MRQKSLQILLVDDHMFFRKALCKLIQSFPFSKVIHEASNGIEALGILSSNSMDIVLLDVQMPVLNGMETIKRIQALPLKPPVIVLTQSEEPSLIYCMVRYGARGFLLKDCDPEKLSEAILAVTNNKYFFSERALSVIQDNISENDKPLSLEIFSRRVGGNAHA